MTTGGETIGLPSGGAIPLVGFGTWDLRGSRAREAIGYALTVGYRHLDTATAYDNEREVGRAVRDSGVPRSDVFITTKLPPDDAGRARAVLEASLAALGVDYVDLWLVHWPPGRRASPRTWEQLLALRGEGLARAVGVSNYGTGQIDELIAATGVAPEVNQVKWSPALHDPTFAADMRERRVVLEGYSPFRAGSLDDPVLREVAAAHAVTPAQIVVRWHVQHGIVVIPKSARPERITSNFDVFGFALDDDEMRRIDALGGGRRD